VAVVAPTTSCRHTTYTWWRIFRFTAKTWIVWDGIWRFVSAVQRQHETAMRNWVCVHLYSRLVRYFYDYEACERKTSNWIWKLRVYEELFLPNHSTVRSLEIVDFLRKFYLPEDFRGLPNSEKCWWSLVPFTHRLGVYVFRTWIPIVLSVSYSPPRNKKLAIQRHGSFWTVACKSKNQKCNKTQNHGVHNILLVTVFQPELQEILLGGSGEQRNHTVRKGRTAFAMSFTTNGVYCLMAMNRYGDGISTKSKLPKKPNKKTTVVVTSTTRTNIPDFWV